MKDDLEIVVENLVLDKEWVFLIAAAKQLGLSKAEVIAFLRGSTHIENTRVI